MKAPIELTDCDGDSVELLDFASEEMREEEGKEALLRMSVDDGMTKETHAAVLLNRENAGHLIDWLTDFFKL